MELAFATKSLRDLCAKEEVAQRSLGIRVAETLKRRLADLRAAASTKDVPAGRPIVVSSEGNGKITVDLCDGARLTFSANHNVIPRLHDGGVDWARVTRIKILLIEGAHA